MDTQVEAQITAIEGISSQLIFVNWNLGIDALEPSDHRSKEQSQQSNMSDHKPGLMTLPGKSDGGSTEYGHGQQCVETIEPPGLVDEELYGRCSVSSFYERGKGQRASKRKD